MSDVFNISRLDPNPEDLNAVITLRTVINHKCDYARLVFPRERSIPCVIKSIYLALDRDPLGMTSDKLSVTLEVRFTDKDTMNEFLSKPGEGRAQVWG